MICNIELDQGERELIKAVPSTEARRSAATAAGLREDLHRGAIEDEERTVARIKRLDYEAATMTLLHSKITEQERDALLAAWYRDVRCAECGRDFRPEHEEQDACPECIEEHKRDVAERRAEDRHAYRMGLGRGPRE